MPQELNCDKPNIGSGIGFLQCDCEALPDPIVTYRCHMVSLGHNKLIS